MESGVMSMMTSRGIVLAVLTILAVLVSTTLYAQTGPEPAATATGYMDLRTSQSLFAVPDERAVSIRQSLAATDFRGVAVSRRDVPAFQAEGVGRQRSTTRKVLGGIIGGVGGFFGGAFLGAAIEGDRCHCDDPGLMGFLIGAPIGAPAGAILGVKFF